jgi:alpha-1,6-mannosyltransferase
VKICDVTQFYSPLSGGVKRYVHEKAAYIERHTPENEHVLIVPGPQTNVRSIGRTRLYSVHSPLVSRTSQYRALLNLRAIEEIIAREQPNILESSDPYQVGWKALRVGRALGVPIIGFYHSHFPDAYLRTTAERFGQRMTRAALSFSERYVPYLYNQFAATIVASESLAAILRRWGVENVQVVPLGVDTDVFCPRSEGIARTRAALGVATDQKLLLYVGRLAKEKNTPLLFDTFELLHRRCAGDFHLLVIGDGPERNRLLQAQKRTGGDITWIQYCAEARELARYYCAADLLVHPGVQETFGLVALEAQACGTPVVGVRGSRLDAVILHDQASWAGESTPDALADAIEAMSARDLRAIGREASQLSYQRHRWSLVFAQLFCIYRKVCAKYRRS